MAALSEVDKSVANNALRNAKAATDLGHAILRPSEVGERAITKKDDHLLLDCCQSLVRLAMKVRRLLDNRSSLANKRLNQWMLQEFFCRPLVSSYYVARHYYDSF